MPRSLSFLLGLLVAQRGYSLSIPLLSSPSSHSQVDTLSKRATEASNSVASTSNFGIPRADGTRSSPWALSSDAFRNALDRPDSTATFEFLGQDLSISYSGIGLTPGWTLGINVSNNVPLTSSTETTTSDGVSVRDKATSASRIRIGAPAKLLRGNGVFMDPTWNFCVFLLTSPGLTLQDRLRGDNGSCATVMGDQCAADIVTAVQTNTNGTGKGAGGANLCSCPDLSLVPSCRQANVFQGGVQCSTYCKLTHTPPPRYNQR
jgi:hypothetical protein